MKFSDIFSCVDGFLPISSVFHLLPLHKTVEFVVCGLAYLLGLVELNNLGMTRCNLFIRYNLSSNWRFPFRLSDHNTSLSYDYSYSQ